MAGAAVAGSTHTYAAEALSKQFHRMLPNDGRFVALTRMKKSPNQQVTQEHAEFTFAPSPMIYLVNDIVFEISVRLVEKSTQGTPADGTEVGPVNNTMHSMIKNLKLTVNGFPSNFFLDFSSFLKLMCVLFFKFPTTETIMRFEPTTKTY